MALLGAGCGPCMRRGAARVALVIDIRPSQGMQAPRTILDGRLLVDKVHCPCEVGALCGGQCGLACVCGCGGERARAAGGALQNPSRPSPQQARGALLRLSWTRGASKRACRRLQLSGRLFFPLRHSSSGGPIPRKITYRDVGVFGEDAHMPLDGLASGLAQEQGQDERRAQASCPAAHSHCEGEALGLCRAARTQHPSKAVTWCRPLRRVERRSAFTAPRAPIAKRCSREAGRART